MFVRNKESFECEQCGIHVDGDGYTNHCPQCFTSKHVDIDPGDREADCGGLMSTINVELKRDEYVLVQQCLKCGYQRRNKVQPMDNIDALITLQKKLVHEAAHNLE